MCRAGRARGLREGTEILPKGTSWSCPNKTCSTKPAAGDLPPPSGGPDAGHPPVCRAKLGPFRRLADQSPRPQALSCTRNARWPQLEGSRIALQAAQAPGAGRPSRQQLLPVSPQVSEPRVRAHHTPRTLAYPAFPLPGNGDTNDLQ